MFRIIDFTLSLIGLILLSPIFVLIFIVTFIDTGSPLFRQERIGRHENSFTLVKFRTMQKDTASVASHLADVSAITSTGSFLRKTHLDELPQLFNVLKGDMSLVGPRPLLIEYLPLYSKSQARRHEVKPGITGWAQINGRNAITWSKKFQLDVWYVDNMSIWLDIKILCLTIKKVIMREGINQPGHSTIEVFRGNDGKE
jgi:lipopolysaccharide/colanic/teichoic acid biosynthesis glycosyltransferase